MFKRVPKEYIAADDELKARFEEDADEPSYRRADFFDESDVDSDSEESQVFSRAEPLDQIQQESSESSGGDSEQLETPGSGAQPLPAATEADGASEELSDLVSSGQEDFERPGNFYCSACPDKVLISDADLQLHLKGKLHARNVKELNRQQLQANPDILESKLEKAKKKRQRIFQRKKEARKAKKLLKLKKAAENGADFSQKKAKRAAKKERRLARKAEAAKNNPRTKSLKKVGSKSTPTHVSKRKLESKSTLTSEKTSSKRRKRASGI